MLLCANNPAAREADLLHGRGGEPPSGHYAMLALQQLLATG